MKIIKVCGVCGAYMMSVRVYGECVCLHVCMFFCVYACVCACVFASVYEYVYTCTVYSYARTLYT